MIANAAKHQTNAQSLYTTGDDANKTPSSAPTVKQHLSATSASSQKSSDRVEKPFANTVDAARRTGYRATTLLSLALHILCYKSLSWFGYKHT